MWEMKRDARGLGEMGVRESGCSAVQRGKKSSAMALEPSAIFAGHPLTACGW